MGGIKEELSSVFRSLSVATTISMAVVFSTFAGVLTGYYIDTRLFGGRTSPWFTLICLFLGIAGGVKNFMVLSKRFTENAKKEADKERERAAKRPEDDDQQDSKR